MAILTYKNHRWDYYTGIFRKSKLYVSGEFGETVGWKRQKMPKTEQIEKKQ